MLLISFFGKCARPSGEAGVRASDRGGVLVGNDRPRKRPAPKTRFTAGSRLRLLVAMAGMWSQGPVCCVSCRSVRLRLVGSGIREARPKSAPLSGRQTRVADAWPGNVEEGERAWTLGSTACVRRCMLHDYSNRHNDFVATPSKPSRWKRPLRFEKLKQRGPRFGSNRLYDEPASAWNRRQRSAAVTVVESRGKRQQAVSFSLSEIDQQLREIISGSDGWTVGLGSSRGGVIFWKRAGPWMWRGR